MPHQEHCGGSILGIRSPQALQHRQEIIDARGQRRRDACRKHSTKRSSPAGAGHFKCLLPELSTLWAVVLPQHLKRHHRARRDEQRSVVRAREAGNEIASPTALESQTSHAVIEQHVVGERDPHDVIACPLGRCQHSFGQQAVQIVGRGGHFANRRLQRPLVEHLVQRDPQKAFAQETAAIGPDNTI